MKRRKGIRPDDGIESTKRNDRNLPPFPDDDNVHEVFVRLRGNQVGLDLEELGIDLKQISFLIAHLIHREILWNEANIKKGKAKDAVRNHLKKIRVRNEGSSKYNRSKHLKALTAPIARRIFAAEEAMSSKRSRTKQKPYFNFSLFLLWAVISQHTGRPYKYIASLIHLFELYERSRCANCPSFSRGRCKREKIYLKPCFETTRHRIWQRVRTAKNIYPDLQERLLDPLNQS